MAVYSYRILTENQTEVSFNNGNVSSISPLLTTGNETLLEFALNGSTPVILTSAYIPTNLNAVFSLLAVGGTVGATPIITSWVPGVSMTVVGTAGDTSTYFIWTGPQ